MSNRLLIALVVVAVLYWLSRQSECSKEGFGASSCSCGPGCRCGANCRCGPGCSGNCGSEPFSAVGVTPACESRGPGSCNCAPGCRCGTACTGECDCSRETEGQVTGWSSSMVAPAAVAEPTMLLSLPTHQGNAQNRHQLVDNVDPLK